MSTDHGRPVSLMLYFSGALLVALEGGGLRDFTLLALGSLPSFLPAQTTGTSRQLCVCVCVCVCVKRLHMHVLVCMGLLLGIVYAYRSIEIFSCHETGHEEQCSYTGPMHNIQ